MLIPSYMFHLIITAVGNNMLLKTPLKAFTRSPYTAKLSHVTARLDVSQLDDFRQTIEQFFESRNCDRFRVLELQAKREAPRGTLPHGSPRLLCHIHATKLTFDVCGKWESVRANNLKILLNFGVGRTR
jgi:hypothetical protein